MLFNIKKSTDQKLKIITSKKKMAEDGTPVQNVLTDYERNIFLKSAFAALKVKTLTTQLSRLPAEQTVTIVQHIYLMYLDEIYNNSNVRQEILLARKHLNVAMLAMILQQQ